MSRRSLLCAALAVAIPLAGCTSDPGPQPLPPPAPPAPGTMRLVAFDSCEQLAADLTQAAKASVGPYGFPGGVGMPEVLTANGARTMADAAPAAAAAPAFSGTNNHELNADEPDIVKTDGRRIVTVTGGTLRVIDAATRRETGRLNLDLQAVGGEVNLLLSGDVALVLVPGTGGRFVFDRRDPGAEATQVLSVDLSGPPRIISRYKSDATLVDARLTGATARVVLKTAPRIVFPENAAVSDEGKRISANRAAIDRAPLDAWLPTWEVTTGTETRRGKTDCGRVSRPADYSGASMVNILTFDLTTPTLGDGDPVSVVADGDTVYANGDSLYLASDQRWRLDRFMGRAAKPVRQETDLYRFTTTGNQPPAYAAAGHIPGFLINQYAMSEWNGHLRVATTDESKGQSAVRVLRQDGDKLVQAGVVDGLYLPGFGPEDANRDIGDSTITETIGIGGMAMAAAPAIVRFVGGSPADAVAATLSMYDITWAESGSYLVPTLGFRGTPLGIDCREVVHTGVLPTVNTGIAAWEPGVGQVGAGLVEPPMEAFVAATQALAATG